MSDNIPIAVVTGASRGAGRGIAIGLGSYGHTVYVTGRSEKKGDASLPGTIYETAEAVTAAGGKGIPVRVDHADDAQVKALFDQVEAEQGRIDILVNNAAAVHDELTAPGNFWEKPLWLVDMIEVGVRSSYVSSYYAAPMMAARKKGLVVFTSGSGAAHYVFGPAYGAHKASMDKFAHDMGVEFRDFGITALSVWMGALLTERLKMVIESDPVKFDYVAKMAETPEFTGRVLGALYADPALHDRNGQTLIIADVAREYGLTDEDGRQPVSYRETHKVAPLVQYPAIIR
ncbi:SDR family NAD(P)-dependent oxidoreductase [Sphingomonas naphthae]|uniref:SDR family NAD(P)-dependent oxidoreductase n=1 Tax=Sphingomonas naphthae TaxID=1813468 RepID=A0ABY7TMH1_9SPHN|nr:SDR family NAD(P)-dependent oxidoreductase [Sphingomonas naphthae]WCT74433.1 SDR family NAD(P)-dependent oxidoreductase [Sphingomonas naphthae]